MRLDGRLGEPAEAVVAHLGAGVPDQPEVGRQQAAQRQVVDGGQQLALRQVAGRPEDREQRRLGGAADPQAARSGFSPAAPWLGMAVPGAFADIADVIVTFEGSYEDYLVEGEDAVYEPLSWEPGPDQAIWHMIHHTPDATRAAEVAALGLERGADLVYVTDNGGANPYSSLPSNEIWTSSRSSRGGWRGAVAGDAASHHLRSRRRTP